MIIIILLAIIMVFPQLVVGGVCSVALLCLVCVSCAATIDCTEDWQTHILTLLVSLYIIIIRIAHFDLRASTLKQIQNGHCHHQFFINKRPTLILGEDFCPGASAKRLWQFGSGGEGQPIATQLKNKRLACEATDYKQ